MKKYKGSCHCQAVQFEVLLPDQIECERCNCSICSKAGFVHVIVPRASFSSISGEDTLTRYSFNTGVAQHTFCKVCGIKPYYVPRSNPDGVSINLAALDSRPEKVVIVDFDGQNWEENAHKLAHKSQ